MSKTTLHPVADKGTTPTLLDEPVSELLVDPEWIADHIDDPGVRLVEVDVSAAAYDAGHIPGAILWNAYSDLRGPNYIPIAPRAFATLLARSDITPERTIVFYGYGAYLGFWLMKRYGHERVALMDGPRERWERAGYEWTRSAPNFSPVGRRVPTEDETVVASREAVIELIGRPEGLILDVRSHAEFAGERFWPSGATEDAGRAGHIPDAVHVPWDLVRDEEGMLRSAEELRSLYETSGIGRDRWVVTYCTIGNRASQVWFALKYVLGYPDVRVYYGSWVEWGKLADSPIEA